MSQFDRIRGAVEQRGIPVLKHRRHFRMQRAEDDQAADDLRCTRSETIDFGLQQRAEVSQLFAMEILKLVEGDDVTSACQPADQLCQLAQAGYPRIDAEGFQIAVAGGHDAGGVGIRDLYVEGLVDPGVAQCLLDQRGLADAPPP